MMMCVCVCVCVCVNELYVREYNRWAKCVSVNEQCVGEDKKNVCVCVCVCASERERERERENEQCVGEYNR